MMPVFLSEMKTVGLGEVGLYILVCNISCDVHENHEQTDRLDFSHGEIKLHHYLFTVYSQDGGYNDIYNGRFQMLAYAFQTRTYSKSATTGWLTVVE